MQKAAIVLLFLCIISNAFSQDYDLIVTTTGDSIACRIDSITDASIYMKMRSANKWVNTSIMRDAASEYKYNAIDRKAAIFRPGTSYIMLYGNPAYLMKAQTLQRTGTILTIAGGSILGITLLSEIVFHNRMGLEAIVIGLVGGSVGLATTISGIAINNAGKKRVERITSDMSTSYSGITIDLKPCAQYNLMTQTYQPGVTLRVRF